MVPVSHGRFVDRHCPTSALRVIPGAGHVSVLEATPDALRWLVDRCRTDLDNSSWSVAARGTLLWRPTTICRPDPADLRMGLSMSAFRKVGRAFRRVGGVGATAAALLVAGAASASAHVTVAAPGVSAGSSDHDRLPSSGPERDRVDRETEAPVADGLAPCCRPTHTYLLFGEGDVFLCAVRDGHSERGWDGKQPSICGRNSSWTAYRRRLMPAPALGSLTTDTHDRPCSCSARRTWRTFDLCRDDQSRHAAVQHGGMFAHPQGLEDPGRV